MLDTTAADPSSDAARPALLPGLDGGSHSSATLYRRLLETSPDAVLVVDGTGRILFANQQAEELFAYSVDELLGQSVEMLVPQRLRAGHAIHRAQYATAPHPRSMGSGLALFGQRRNGAEFPVEISLSPMTIEGQTLFSANIRDITERRRNESDLRRLQAQLLSAVESIQGAFALFDAADRLVVCNSAYRQIIARLLPDEVVGRGFGELIDASIASGTFDLNDTTPADLARRWSEYHANPSGSLEAKMSSGEHLRIIERRTADGGVVATMWDMTDEVGREDELRNAHALAEAASAAKTEFLASMSHELRTPLNAILGFAQLLQRDKKTPLTTRQQERVDHVLRGGEHLLRLIDDVLDLARIEAGRVLISLEPVNLGDVLTEVKDTLDPMATRTNVALEIDSIEPPARQVLADRTRLSQILMNFGSNAIKYGRSGGKARFCVERHEGIARISVIDDGMGIALEKQAVIFQPFQRAGQEAGPIEGTGIGLVITKRLAELMHGSVGFESAEGRGSCFWIELPIHRLSQVDTEAPMLNESLNESTLCGREGPRYCIVYIEDNPSNIAFMQDLLADFERVELLTAPNAEIGIELVRARRPDIVIMDINLPGMSGFEATRKLAAWPETRGVPVIALSAAAMGRDASRLAGAGFYRYLTKPVKVDELTRVLDELLAQAENPTH